MSDSVGKISLDLEVKSDLNKQISSTSKMIGKQLQSDVSKVTKSISFGNIAGNFSKSLKNSLSGIKREFGKMKKVKMPTSFIDDSAAKTSAPKASRTPKINTEYTKAQIENIAAQLDNVNARITNQQSKLADLKKSYTNAFNSSTKNKIQEDILKTEASINKLIGTSDKLGFKLVDLDDKLANVGNESKKAASKVSDLSKKVQHFSNSAPKMNNINKQLALNTKKTANSFFGMGKATKSAAKTISGSRNDMKMFFDSLFKWGLVFPIVIGGITAMAKSLWQSLQANKDFATSTAQIRTNLQIAFMPIYQAILPALNALMKALSTATTYLAIFFSALAGKTYQQSKQSAQELIKAKEAMGAYGASAKKAGKDVKGALASFDEVNTLNLGDDSGGEGGAPELVTPNMDTSAIDLATGKVNLFIENIKKELDRFKGLFKEGFNIGIGGNYKEQAADIKKSFEGIKKSLLDIFLDPELQTAAREMTDSIVKNAGIVAGSVVSIGTSIAQNLMSGINKYLEQNKQFVRERLLGIFNIVEDISGIIGEFAAAFADVFSVFGNETAQQITANVIEIFTNTWLATQELTLMYARSILDTLLGPFIENKDLIKKTLEELLKPIETITGTIAKLVTNTFSKVLEVYQEYVEPAFTNIKEGLTSLMETALTVFNEHILPVINKVAEDFRVLADEHIQPAIDSAIEAFGELFQILSEVFKNAIIPLTNYIIETMGPYLELIFNAIATAFKVAMEILMTVLKGVFDNFKLFLEFIRNVFTGDWEAAWENIQQMFANTKEVLGTIIESLKTAFIELWQSIKQYASDTWENVKSTWSVVKQWFSSTIIDPLARAFDSMWNGIKTTCRNVFSSLVGIVKSPLNAIIGLVNSVIRGLNKISIDIPDWVPGSFGGKKFGVNIPSVPKLARGGIVDQPTLAMVGEAGKEAVVPLENNVEWVGKIASLIASALLPLMGNGGGSSSEMNRDIVVNLGDVELVRAFLPTLLKEMNRQGVTFP